MRNKSVFNSFNFFILGLFTSLILSLQTATAQTGSSRPWLLSQGAAAREAKRFTLQEWLENKDRRALMDMWLSINTPTPYEFMFGGSLQSYTLQTSGAGSTATQSYKAYTGEVSAYARFVGITMEHTNNTEEAFNDVTGLFNLRIFGNSLQSSHLTLHYGLRTRTGQNGLYRLNQPFPAATLQIYLMKYFGIQGQYRHYGNTSESFYGDSVSDELTYGAFIEYGLLRIFGDVYQERQNSRLNNIETRYQREGTRVGVKFFF